MRERVPRPLRIALSPLRTAAWRARDRIARRVWRGAGGVRRYRYVFVVTYGRSGSTLLNGLLNAIPGYRIRGENYNALYRLYQADAAIAQAAGRFASADHLTPRSPWYGTPLTRPHRFRAELAAAFVRNVLRPRPGDRVLGFKEIRYTPEHVADLTRYLTFLGEAFPGAKIIFNHRDPAAVAGSGWWTDVDGAARKIAEADERLRGFPPDDRHFHFCYDEIDDSLANVRALFRFLGERFDEPTVRRVLGTAHSPYPVRA